MRSQMIKFMKKEAIHTDIVNEVVNSVITTSEAAGKENGALVLFKVRDMILHEGQMLRNAKVKRPHHHFKVLLHKSEFYSHSNYKCKCNNQKIYLQMLAADLEAISLIKFMDNNLVQKQVTRKYPI